ERARGGPLAPATVNIRLTALRQFLIHCAVIGALADLTPDRIRTALRRLQIHRPRPDQILAEAGWAAFLAAAAPARTPAVGGPARCRRRSRWLASDGRPARRRRMGQRLGPRREVWAGVHGARRVPCDWSAPRRRPPPALTAGSGPLRSAQRAREAHRRDSCARG